MKLEKGIKELISIGASVAANCRPCLGYWIDHAQSQGVDAGAIMEAIEIGKAVRKGAAEKLDQEAELLTGVARPTGATGQQSRCTCG